MIAPSNPRWFYLTLGRLVLFLMLIEGFLWLSEQLRWFSFNQHKNWTILIALACVGALLLLISAWFVAALCFRLRFQYTIRSLLALDVVVAVPFGWLTVEMQKATRQRQSVEAIGTLRGYVVYDYMLNQYGSPATSTAPPGAAWLRNLFGDDFFTDVIWVDFNRSEVTNAGLEHLKGLVQLRSLWLRGTKITDAGAEHLKGLRHLEDLAINGTEVTDAGLDNIRALSQLRRLWLGGTRVSDDGVKRLQEALPNCQISR
jgi:hypothetical protein